MIVLDEPKVITGGWEIGQFDERNQVYVMRTFFNYRLVVGDETGYHGFWCYYGLGPATFIRVVAAAQAWLISGEDEPRLWNKNGQTRTYRADEEWE